MIIFLKVLMLCIQSIVRQYILFMKHSFENNQEIKFISPAFPKPWLRIQLFKQGNHFGISLWLALLFVPVPLSENFGIFPNKQILHRYSNIQDVDDIFFSFLFSLSRIFWLEEAKTEKVIDFFFFFWFMFQNNLIFAFRLSTRIRW